MIRIALVLLALAMADSATTEPPETPPPSPPGAAPAKPKRAPRRWPLGGGGSRVPFALPGAPRPPGTAPAPVEVPQAEPGTLQGLLARYPADALAEPLRRFEAEHGRTPEGAEAAFLLGQLHYARGEYRGANEAFARAAARFPPARKPEARYWQGLSALGQGDPVQARSALEEVAQPGSPRRAEARYALAEAWVKGGRIERGIEELKALLADEPGPMEAPALARLAGLSERIGDVGGAKRAAAQLQKVKPGAVEAAAQRSAAAAAGKLPVATATRTEKGRIAVQIGAFSDPVRARALLDAAKRAGYDRAQLVVQGAGGATLHVVRIGFYASEDDARIAGERASRELGVAYRLVRYP